MGKWITVGLFAVSMAAVALPATPAYADGAALWKTHCTKCHGDSGNGDTKMGKKLKATDLTKADFQDKKKDEEIEKSIKDGSGEKDAEGETPMPGFEKKLKPEEMKELVKHLRGLKK